MTALSVEVVALPPSPSGFACAAKRYTLNESDLTYPGGLTLLLLHCVGAHKEQWEPLLERLFSLVNNASDSGTERIREAWAMDRVNHGDSVGLNGDLVERVPQGISVEELTNDQPRGSSIYDWSPCIASLIASPRLKDHRIVGIGHSAGASALILPLSENPRLFESLILIEPSLVTKEVFYSAFEDRMTQMELAVGATSLRRDVWKNMTKEALFKWFSDRFPWNGWDPRVVKIYSEYGVKQTGSELSLKCPKMQEAASFVDTKAHFEATAKLALVCSRIPVHVLFSEELEFLPQLMRDSICDIDEGRRMESVHVVPDCGHFMVQEQPDNPNYEFPSISQDKDADKTKEKSLQLCH